MRYTRSIMFKWWLKHKNRLERLLATTPDTTPDQFELGGPVVDAVVSTVYFSDLITITGIDAPAVISITDGEYQVNGGTWTALPSTVELNDTVLCRLTSPADPETLGSLTLLIDTVSDNFDVTTAAAPAFIQLNTTITEDGSTLVFANAATLAYAGLIYRGATAENLSRVEFYAYSITGSINGKTYEAAIFQLSGGNFNPAAPLKVSTSTVLGVNIIAGQYIDFEFPAGDITGDVAVLIYETSFFWDTVNLLRISGTPNVVDGNFYMARYTDAGVLQAELASQARANLYKS